MMMTYANNRMESVRFLEQSSCERLRVDKFRVLTIEINHLEGENPQMSRIVTRRDSAEMDK